MNRSEQEILEQIELGFLVEDAAFARRIADGPRLSVGYKAGLAAIVGIGISLVMMFPVNLMLGVAGYLVLVVAGTRLLRQRPLKPVDESPLELFHRTTAGLFRNTDTIVESSFD